MKNIQNQEHDISGDETLKTDVATHQSLRDMTKSRQHIQIAENYGAHNYHPLPVVVEKAEDVWVYDADGKRYLDMLAAYSAINFGHINPELLKTAQDQLSKVTLTSRAFHNDQLGPFCQELAELCGMEMVLPMNTGAEGVETAIKTARKWGYQKKGVTDESAKIICCTGNFHGRTTTIISFSTDEQARGEFGPYTPGFEIIPFGDSQALARAIDEDTVAFLFEPIQGEGGIIIPPNGYLREVRRICSENNILMIADEIQSGLGRTGRTFACEHENVQPDVFILGKALGGGIMPVSAVVSSREILGVYQPGDHGSTFGGNPLACAIARKVIALLKTQKYQQHAQKWGHYLKESLQKAALASVKEIRGQGLWIGIELKKEFGSARPVCEKLMHDGILCKETHDHVIRLAPPLTIQKQELDWAIERLTMHLT